MDKPVLFYTVRAQVNRQSGQTILVPSIVDREPAVTLDEIIADAIDRGLIAGIKPSAATQIAEAIAQQMYEEFKAGRGVKFGNYFYCRLYLDGTSDADGRLGDMFTWGDVWNMLGEGFTGTEPGWVVEVAMLSTAPEASTVNLDFDVKSATEVELTPGAGAELEAGDYPNAMITFGIAHQSEEGLDTESAEIPIRLVVSD